MVAFVGDELVTIDAATGEYTVHARGVRSFDVDDDDFFDDVPPRGVHYLAQVEHGIEVWYVPAAVLTGARG